MVFDSTFAAVTHAAKPQGYSPTPLPRLASVMRSASLLPVASCSLSCPPPFVLALHPFGLAGPVRPAPGAISRWGPRCHPTIKLYSWTSLRFDLHQPSLLFAPRPSLLPSFLVFPSSADAAVCPCLIKNHERPNYRQILY